MNMAKFNYGSCCFNRSIHHILEMGLLSGTWNILLLHMGSKGLLTYSNNAS